jgi:cobalamin biosynthetic protein CobC
MSEAFTWHGGRMAEAQARLGGDPSAWIDLSTGINPCPWPGAATIRPDWRSLPEPGALARLEMTAAGFFGVDPAHVCAVPGSEMALRLLVPVLGPLPASHLSPCYRTHGAIFPQNHAIEETGARACKAAVLLLANPNNPDGRIVAHDRLMSWLAQQEGRRGWLVVDEAFADAHPEISIAPQVTDDRRLIVLRSFGKFFGLAGVRLGFVVAPQPIVAAYRQLLGDWPVSAAALSIGAGAYNDMAWINATRAALPERAAQLDAVLARHGLRATGRCPLFRLIAAEDAHRLFERLGRRAILTRPFAERPDWLRIGLPADATALARLDEALGHG